MCKTSNKTTSLELDAHYNFTSALCDLQQIHDDIEKDERFLSDPENPFIDNGLPLSQRFCNQAEEIKSKTEYLIKMMLDQGILKSEEEEPVL